MKALVAAVAVVWMLSLACSTAPTHQPPRAEKSPAQPPYSIQPAPPEPQITPSGDGVHITGAIVGLYPIEDGGTCGVADLQGSLQLFISASPHRGEPYFGAILNGFTGPGLYTDLAVPPTTHSSLYVAQGDRVWHAASGLVIVQLADATAASGTIAAGDLRDVDGAMPVSASGSWRCNMITPVPSQWPSPSPTPSPTPPYAASPSPLPMGSPVPRQPLAPAQDLPLVGLCSAPLQYTADGNAQPLLCRGGEVNVQAWNFYKAVEPSVLGLPRSATLQDIYAAMCRDGQTINATRPEVEYSYQIAAAYHAWTYVFNYDAWTCQ